MSKTLLEREIEILERHNYVNKVLYPEWNKISKQFNDDGLFIGSLRELNELHRIDSELRFGKFIKKKKSFIDKLISILKYILIKLKS